MKTAFGFVIAFLFFSVGVQGRMGSMLAVFIDPGALVDVSANASTPTSTVDPVAAATALADTYAKNNGGVRPTPVMQPGTLNQCSPGWTYNYQVQQCLFSGTTGRHA